MQEVSLFEIFVYIVIFIGVLWMGHLMLPGKKESEALKKELDEYYRKK